MTRILLLSHGSLAKEFLKTAELIMGKNEDLDYMELSVNEDMESYSRQIEKKINEGREMLILTDLLGGSPLIKAAECYKRIGKASKIRIITGMNLPMILEVANNSDLPLDELSGIAIDTGTRGIVDFLKKIEEGE